MDLKVQPPHISRYRGPICSRMISEEEIDQEKKEHMKSMYSTHFEKFRKIPRFHRFAAGCIKSMEKNKLGIKAAMINFPKQLNKTSRMLVSCAAQYSREIDYVLKKTTVLEDDPSLNIYVIKVLTAQLLCGHQSLPLGTKEASHLLYYETDLKEAFVEASTVLQTTYLSKLPIYVRVNTLSISLEQCINAFCKEGWNLLQCPKSYKDYLAVVSKLKKQEFIRDFHISELLVFPPTTSFYEHPGYLRGKFVLQDKSSCLASFLLNPKPGSRVFDMCAAPGKTTNHIANIVNNEANVYAVDNHPHRYNQLYSFLHLTNSTCVETMLAETKHINIDNLNYVLIDAPSTYTGIFYKRPREGLGRRLKQYYNSSFKLLMHALTSFTNVKRIVYTSCTNYPEEGEKVVEYALKHVGDSYKLLDVKELLWNQWFSVGQTETHCGSFPTASKCLRTNPEIDKCHACFIAVFERNFEVPVPAYVFVDKWEKHFDQINEDESDNESLHDGSDKQKPESENFQNNTFKSKPFTKKFENKTFKSNPFKKFKVYHSTSKKSNCVARPHSQTPQTSTSGIQMQNSYPGSLPFYEVSHSQFHP